MGRVWHIVLFRTASGVSSERVSKVRSLFEACVGACEGLEWVRFGGNQSQSRFAQGWNQAVTMEFRDVASLASYLTHPLHLGISQETSQGFYDDLVVYDLDADPGAAHMPGRPPVDGFPLNFEWDDRWTPFFDEQIRYIRSELERAVADDRVIVYLSCPISSRGGGHHGTNVEIAKFVENRLLAHFGERFWILNPTRFQMESREGTGLIRWHARTLNRVAELDELQKSGIKPGGGDYMRMWTQLLVVNRDPETPPVGDYFDMYYFLGPSDVAAFFTQRAGQNLTSAVEEYFARKFTTDPEFHDYYSRFNSTEPRWEAARKDFFRFYCARASVSFSLGSHDEWNIFRLINERRRRLGERVGSQIAGFFDGRQIDPAAAELPISAGYAL